MIRRIDIINNIKDSIEDKNYSKLLKWVRNNMIEIFLLHHLAIEIGRIVIGADYQKASKDFQQKGMDKLINDLKEIKEILSNPSNEEMLYVAYRKNYFKLLNNKNPPRLKIY